MAGEIRFIAATSQHAELLASTMRAADVAELEAMGLDPLRALQLGLERSVLAVSVFVDRQLAAMFGVESLLARAETLLGSEEWAGFWCLTSAAAARSPRLYARTAKRIIAALLERWPVVLNAVDGRYVGAMRMLAMVGAEFSGPVAVGGQPFFVFHIRRGTA